jgi:hypothetical protein
VEANLDIQEYFKPSFEDIVITLAIIVGFLGGVAMLFLNTVPVVIAIFFALGITAFTYRFLGGIDEKTSLTIGALKLTGTAAVLLGSFWLIDYRLVEETKIDSISLPADFQPGNIYLFDATGEPVEKTALKKQGKESVEITFEKLPPDLYKNQSARLLKIENNRLFVATKRDSIFLGFIDEDRESLTDRLLPPSHALALGIYYSQITDKEQQIRIDADRGIDYLSNVLRREDSNDREKKEALQQFYYLQSYFTEPDAFDLLIEMTKKYRSGYFMYHELAETHLLYARKAALNNQKQKLLALINFLSYLGTRQSENDSKKRKEVVKTIDELMMIELAGYQPLIARRQQLLQAVKKHDRPAIIALRNELMVELD